MPALISRTLIILLFLMTAAANGAERRFTVTAPDSVPIAVQESGNPNGPAIIFIHGLLGSHLNWNRQIADPRLQRFRLITFDLRGHGLSGKPDTDAAYREGRRWGDDLAAVINKSQAKRPVLVGWSLGGAVISAYLAEYGDSRIGGALYVGGVVELTPALIPAHPAIYRDMTAADLQTHLDGEREFLRLCFYQQPDRDTFERLLANAAMASWTMQRNVPRIAVPAEKALNATRVPLLFIYGQHDALVNPEASLKRASAINPHIRSDIYANAGHAPFMEDAAQFNAQLEEFADDAVARVSKAQPR
ncbi:alpha/beta hydrolase [Cronobacter sakazakii]|uniref:alpha/beta fold hydrolase n=1 Tax=Cronobacter sakazakii TaxID=28141 RepID=UPI000B3D9D90|nr:alpha/beta hydrolase [Cronobacter sakazakii]ELY3812260.1 alpha/beta hydrolase [Cronobacter sakazakii]PUW93057.1 alpha/beta hydrolase [Cronobacter sakazakii]